MESLQKTQEQLKIIGKIWGLCLFSGARVYDIDQIQGIYDFPHLKDKKNTVLGKTAQYSPILMCIIFKHFFISPCLSQ